MTENWKEKTMVECVLGWDMGVNPPRSRGGYFHDLLREDWFKEGGDDN